MRKAILTLLTLATIAGFAHAGATPVQEAFVSQGMKYGWGWATSNRNLLLAWFKADDFVTISQHEQDTEDSLYGAGDDDRAIFSSIGFNRGFTEWAKANGYMKNVEN